MPNIDEPRGLASPNIPPELGATELPKRPPVAGVTYFYFSSGFAAGAVLNKPPLVAFEPNMPVPVLGTELPNNEFALGYSPAADSFEISGGLELKELEKEIG